MNNWRTKNIGEICEVIAGQSPEGKFYNQNGKGLPFYQGKKEFGPRYIGDPTVWTTSTTKEAEKGDILMSVRAPVGPVNFSSQKICIGRGLAAIRCGEEIDKEYLYNYLKFFEDKITGNSGTVFNSINKSQIENIDIPLPPLYEQKRIVKIIDDAFKKLEKAKQNTEKNLQNSKELFESYLNDIFSNPGKDWEEKKLDQISINLDNKRIPITKKDRDLGEYPYYGASGIVDFVSSYIFDNNLLLISEDGANLIDRNYPIAFSVKGKVWVNNHAHVVKFSEIESQKFVEFYLNSIKLDKYVSGAAQPKLNQKKLNSIPIPWPNVDEQKHIVKKLDQLYEKTKKLESLYKQKLANIEELKKSILKIAFSGEL